MPHGTKQRKPYFNWTLKAQKALIEQALYSEPFTETKNISASWLEVAKAIIKACQKWDKMTPDGSAQTKADQLLNLSATERQEVKSASDVAPKGDGRLDDFLEQL